MSAENERLAAMLEEIRASPPEFQPSRFWDFLIGKNLDQLQEGGLERFKSTINQNYYNWIPRDERDNQLQNLLRHWQSKVTLDPLDATIDGPARLEHIMEHDPLGDPKRRRLYALFVGLLWDFSSRHDPYGVLTRLSEPQIGEPVAIKMGSRLISQDLANSAREFTTIMEHLPESRETRRLRFAELGAGYGRLAYVFAESVSCQYWIFDIPPALYIAQWYLSQALPGKKMFFFRHFDRYEEVRDEIESADVCFFTPNQLALVPNRSVDGFASICSLQEMTPEAIRAYLDLIAIKSRSIVYLKQWVRWWNPVDRVFIKKYMYRMSGQWQVALDRRDTVQNLFFETVFENCLSASGAWKTTQRLVGSHCYQVLQDGLTALRRRRLVRGRPKVGVP